MDLILANQLMSDNNARKSKIQYLTFCGTLATNYVIIIHNFKSGAEYGLWSQHE